MTAAFSVAWAASHAERWFSGRAGQRHVADLRDVARGAEESSVGLACRYLVDRTLEGAGGEEEVLDDAGGVVRLRLLALERWCDANDVFTHADVVTWHRRLRRCRRALIALREAGRGFSADALMVAFGPPDPWARDLAGRKVAGDRTLGELFGRWELVALAKYTDAVEARRADLVAERWAARQAWLDERERALGPAMPLAPVLRVLGQTDAVRVFVRYDEWPDDRSAAEVMADEMALPRARLTHEDRATSSADAFLWAIAPNPEPRPVRRIDEDKAPYAERFRAWEGRDAERGAARAEFLLAVRRDADLLLASAMALYHDAWLRVGPAC